jgi:hypothetical protein
VIELVEMLIKAVEMQNLLHFATHTPKISSILYVSAQAQKSRRMHTRPRMQKGLDLWLIIFLDSTVRG